MDLGLEGKRVLITGSTRGLGFAVARLLGREGARVAVNGRTEENVQLAVRGLEAPDVPQPIGLVGDVTDHSIAGKLVDATVMAMGGLDILVTNSGGPPVGAFESFDDAAWQSAVESTFLSHVRLIRAALPQLRKSTAAAVLAITSYSVKHPLDNLILSNSVRAATIGLIKTLSIELGGEGIRFNAILPGWTATARVQDIMKSRAALNRTSAEIEFDKQAAVIPMKRVASPEEFANAAVFLVSPAASYVNGVMLQVDGGATRGIL